MTGEKKEPNKEESEKKGEEELKKQLEDCQKLKDEYLAGWQRARADMLNHKKEEMERVGSLLEYAKIEFVLNLLPVLDNFEIAKKNLTKNLEKEDNVKGLLLIKNQLEEFFKNQGLQEIETIGKKFDPNFHEAVGEVVDNESPQVNGSTGLPQEKSGTIVEEIQKGYTMQGRLLRPAKVKVSK